MSAQNTAPSSAMTSSATADEGFVPVVGGPERTSAEGSVVAAYLIMWAIMVFFLWRTLRLQTVLKQEADTLVKALQQGAP